MACINPNSAEFKDALERTGNPLLAEIEIDLENVNYSLKATNLLQSPKADQFFASATKNKISGDFFWKKMQADLGIPKEQIELLKQYNTTNRDELITNILADYSYAIEINLAKESKTELRETSELIQDGFNYDGTPYYITAEEEYQAEAPTSYYSNLTVPGGTNYTENEIATPAITPSIKGHAQFATDKGIGWFRSDDEVSENVQSEVDYQTYGVESGISGEEIPGTRTTRVVPKDKFTYAGNEYEKKEPLFDEEDYGTISYFKNSKLITSNEFYQAFDAVNQPTKTRRILEVQSDLFQKGRDKKELTKLKDTKNQFTESEEDLGFSFTDENGTFYNYDNFDTGLYYKRDKGEYSVTEISKNEFERAKDSYKKSDTAIPKNQFLQLLNKDNNWVTFFVKSIIQDSSKKGYEKVLFPSGNTASKVEGHSTLDDFKRQKQEAIENAEGEKKLLLTSSKEELGRTFFNPTMFNSKSESEQQELIDKHISTLDRQIVAYKQELERVETEGFGALKPIYNFYETTVANVLKKQGYAPKQVTDEYGNTWNEVEIVPEREQKPILLQKKGTETSAASPETLSMIKDFIKRIGVDIKSVQKIVVNGKKYDANGVAQIMQKLIQVVEGKEASALPEEAMHFAVEIIKQTNPALYKKLLSEINSYRILNQVFTDYGTDPNYQTKDGKPDVVKLKEEAIAKVLAEVIINKSEGISEKPENLEKVGGWWDRIVNWFKELFTKSGFDQLSMDIISGKDIGVAGDIKARKDALFLQKNQDPQSAIYNKIKDVASKITKKKVMEDGEEVEKYFIDGKVINRRVTQLAKDWYSRQRDQKDLTKSEYEKALADLKKEKGTAGHRYFELAFKMFVDENGFLRDVPLDEDSALAEIPAADKAVFGVLKDNLEQRIRTINAEGGGKVRFMTEVTIYDPKRSIAGTIDFLAVTPEGKTYILDWKFMALKTDKFQDIPWYNVNSWRIQMEQYKLIMKSVYGVRPENFEQTRMIPIQAIYTGGDARSGVLPSLDEVRIGDVTVKNIEEDFLLPLSLAEEKTGKEELDTLLGKLNSVYKKFAEKRVLPSERLSKNEQLNTLFKAIRHLQMKNDIKPLLQQAKLLNLQIKKILERYDNEFVGKDPKSFKEEQINEFSADLITAQESLRTYVGLDVDLEFLFPETLTEEDSKLKDDLTKTAGAARKLMNDLEGKNGVINKFASEIIAKSEGIDFLLASEKIIKGFTKLFGSTSTLQSRSIQLLYKKANKAFAYSGMDALQENKRLFSLKEAYDKWARSKGLSTSNYFNIIKKKDKNELIDEYDPKFFSTLKKKIEAKDFDWIRDNVDVANYNKALAIKLEEEIQRSIDKPRLLTEEDAAKMEKYNQTKNIADLPNEIKFEINQHKALYNTSTTESPGWLLYDLINKHPAEKWVSKEWKELHDPKNKAALDFFEYIKEKNEEYRDLGYISRDSSRVFLPFVRKSLMEKIVTKGQLRLGEQFFRSISVDEGDVGYGQTDPLTGKPIDVIPKYFATAIEGDLSTDLFRTMSFYNEAAIRYKYLKQIEEQVRLISTVERNKKAIATSLFGKTEYKDDVLQYTPDNNENSKLYDDMMKSIIYGQRFLTSETFDQLLGKLGSWGETINKKLGINVFPEGLSERQVSVNKLINNLNNTFQLSALGLNVMSASSNFFGGNAQSIINSGKYFTKGDYLASELEIFTQRLNVPNQKKILAALEYFLPLTENYNKEFAKKLSLNTLTQESLQDGLMILMRKTDLNVQTANFLSFLKNSIVEDGKVVNAREFLRSQPKYENIYAGTVEQRKTLENQFEEDVKKLVKEKGILEVSKIVDNQLVIPGVDQKSESVVDFRRKVQQLSKDALGNLTEDDVRMINMSVYGKSFMVFKNWIPRLIDVRMGNLKYNVGSDAYEWGRTRMIFRVIKEDWWRSLRNLQGSLVANERGVEFMRELYEKKKADYEKDTGKELNMTEAQFIELVRGNIKSQAIDLVFYTAMLILVAGIKNLPDDEEDPAVKNQYRFFVKMADKFKDEISYFYDPSALLKTVSGNVFPAISLLDNFKKGVGNFLTENWALMEGDQETVDDTYVIKYWMRTFPFTNQIVGYLPMFYPEMAKDLGIKMQKNYGVR